jgi:hypothetical protein
MLRTLILSALLGLSALSVPAATAQGPCERFPVFYRRDCHCGWQCVTFRCWEEADREACRLRRDGFEVLILPAATAQRACSWTPGCHGVRCRVYFRPDCHCEWECLAFRCWEDGDREACRLRQLGFQVMTIRS